MDGLFEQHACVHVMKISKKFPLLSEDVAIAVFDVVTLFTKFLDNLPLIQL